MQWYSAAYYKGIARYEWDNRKIHSSALDASTAKCRYLKEQCHPMPLSEILFARDNEVHQIEGTPDAIITTHWILESSYLYLMGIVIFVAFCIQYYLKNKEID